MDKKNVTRVNAVRLTDQEVATLCEGINELIDLAERGRLSRTVTMEEMASLRALNEKIMNQASKGRR